jgi:hypothetical protein
LLSNIKVKKFTTRDEQEVAGYADVLELLYASWEHIAFNENHIQQLHRDLLQHSNKDTHHQGRYKKISNKVAAFNEKGEQVAAVSRTNPKNSTRQMPKVSKAYSAANPSDA